MADSFCHSEGGPSQDTELETAAPPTPPMDLRAAFDDCRDGKKETSKNETQREKRRKDWQKKKIQDSRTKNRSPQDTTSGEQHGLAGPRLPASQAQSTPSNVHTVHAADEKVCQQYNRTQDEWKVICELKLCAGCLTRTIPPHKPGDKRAPCKGLPNAFYDAKEIASIRRSLKKDANKARLQAAPRHTIAKNTHPGKSEQPLYTLSTSDQHESSHGVASSVRRSDPGNSLRGIRSSEGGFPTTENFAPFAPIYNLQDPSSYDQSGVRAALYHQFGPALSQSSATQVDGSTGLASAEQSQHASMPPGKPHPRTPLRRPADLSIDMMGMTPTTPSSTGLPTFHFEDEFGPANQEVQHAANIPVSESSGRAPRSDVEDWDSKTKVSEGAQASELEHALIAGLTSTSSSRDVVEVLIRDKPDSEQFVAERSVTTPGLYCSLGGSIHSGSEWDDTTKTMVDEPQELASDDVIVSKEVLRPVQSAESFFAIRRCASWVQ